ncbi:MAG: trypsin-like serine protease [Polyangiales bacterium]
MRSILVAAILLGACAGDPGGAPASTRQRITNGTPDPADEAVIALVDDSGAVVCTATMLSSHVAVTAAHCGIGAKNYRSFRAVLGPNVSADAFEISDALVHPTFDGASFRDDIAMITIRPEITVKPITTFAAPVLDADVKIVGYGKTSGTKLDTGTKRVGTAKVATVADKTITLSANPSQPCEGDSGGPAFAGDALVALTSNGDPACTMPTTDTRLDAYLDTFVKPYLAARALPGERCFYDGQCATGACTAAEDEPTNTFCAVPCDAGCPTGTTCRDGLCRWPLPSPGAASSSCTRDEDCIASSSAGAECVSSICVRRCNPAAPDCPNDYVCENTGGIRYECVASPPPPVESTGCNTSRTGHSWWLAVVLLGLFRRGTRR